MWLPHGRDFFTGRPVIYKTNRPTYFFLTAFFLFRRGGLLYSICSPKSPYPPRVSSFVDSFSAFTKAVWLKMRPDPRLRIPILETAVADSFPIPQRGLDASRPGGRATANRSRSRKRSASRPAPTLARYDFVVVRWTGAQPFTLNWRWVGGGDCPHLPNHAPKKKYLINLC